ncbi:MAG: hypothetical protein IJ218_03540 [Alphaproteobacteria bacterium]|nr:hypothetical protein [Alphaproteobacteria bacterium]
MLTLERLNALRGISSNAPKPVEPKTATPNNIAQASSIQAAQPQNTQKQPEQKSYPEPVEIPCKNYADEQGHFAYIDANTGQISHVNLETGNIYKLDDVYRLSLQHAVSALSPTYHQLTWQQMLNDETVYDRFGSPIFSFEDIQTAYEKYITPALAKDNTNDDNKPKTDAFGLPII